MPENDWAADVAIENMHAGRWSVYRLIRGDDLVGVLVLALSEVNAGKVVDMIAVKCKPGRYAAAIDEFVELQAKRFGCVGLRMYSPRPVNRLRPDYQPIDAGYMRWLDAEKQ
ncbi:hypothetical protein [Poriferisphaera sp. WC338]|uniref:hypothetical protein n=1 Tax=Poriferisphaera sp. WC338 TaxID=3425129 RepID=UPI003D815013